MLFALRQPATLLGLLLGFGAGCYLRVALQQAFIGGLRSVKKAQRPRSWLDPYGAGVGALLGGVGWSPRPEISRFKPKQVWTMVAAAVVAHAVLAAAGVAAFVAVGGGRPLLSILSTFSVIHGTQFIATSFGQRVALGFGIENLGCGLLALVPIPPLELGVALWSTFPKSPGARRMAYRVLEEQWGVLVILVLLVIPLAGEQPALLQLITAIADRIVQAF